MTIALPENFDSAQVWGVAHTKPYSAALAAEDLKDFGFEVFAPCVQTIEARLFRRRKALRRPIVRPMFPGYLFVAWSLGSEDWARAVSARGVLDLLRTCGKHSAPALVPPGVMAALLAAGDLVDLTGKGASSEPCDFKPGDLVTLDREAFTGHIFRIARLDHRSRIRFILQSLKPGFKDLELDRSSATALKRVVL
jgi:transcription antitermination factor NusG